MKRHACHALGCSTSCPRAHLMCAAHWQLVPDALQLEVYRTAPLRGHRCDETWAPWWRAMAHAIASVAQLEEIAEGRRWLARQIAFADELAGRARRVET